MLSRRRSWKKLTVISLRLLRLQVESPPTSSSERARFNYNSTRHGQTSFYSPQHSQFNEICAQPMKLFVYSGTLERCELYSILRFDFFHLRQSPNDQRCCQWEQSKTKVELCKSDNWNWILIEFEQLLFRFSSIYACGGSTVVGYRIVGDSSVGMDNNGK